MDTRTAVWVSTPGKFSKIFLGKTRNFSRKFRGVSAPALDKNPAVIYRVCIWFVASLFAVLNLLTTFWFVLDFLQLIFWFCLCRFFILLVCPEPVFLGWGRVLFLPPSPPPSPFHPFPNPYPFLRSSAPALDKNPAVIMCLFLS